MSEISLYEAQKKKMQGLCDEHELTYRFQKDTYPITFTIRPTQGVGAQLSMMESVEETGYISPNASMTWRFKDGVLDTQVVGGTFTISKTLRTKIETILVKMINYWQQYFFREVIEKNSLRAGTMPVIDESESDADTDYPDDADADEDLEDDELIEELSGKGLADDDPDVQEAISIVRMENKALSSLLQRRMNIGYAKAARLMDKLEDMGVVGPYNGGEPREVLPYDEPEA